MYFNSFTGDRMDKGQPHCREEQALVKQRIARCSVQGVTHYRMTNAAHVDTELVSSPCPGTEFNQGHCPVL